ncbi:hypothetical protein FC52_GL001088 [Lactobacillus pasteurii DSM 23907 = CRBIP 24.76]|uniref:DUF1659 domain-containing protein n=1 Tax=Lactobacillus pasteurii DSM 23907 = CRBIP 24.76 TaxID=1423790 RepID=I7LD15_9LACO|nr:hypothetical protein [Lactobacillus pasteurii]KRK07176.1 hypothetical protein FC52_GL001088 [Lactobacillus pasteurii DSM 23907 = CRBIP 24.76]TDG75228.1 hypothetical protein C5L33_000296 [Lactobacillus pasteurii]CCI84488.1 Putative uncharacterized protein [Lactobacillus pasteurii DSM 23907 = CRBIP 24.76]
MNFELLEQAVQYGIYNKETDKTNTKVMKYVKETAKAEELASVGKAISQLMGDELHTATLVKYEGIDLLADDNN